MPYQDTLTVFYSIVIEALPFIALGVVVSAILGVFVSDETLLKWIPKNRILGHATVAMLGFVFPVCQCGNIPVARRLIAKGMPLSQAITFLLAAPVFNPVVILATYTAFSFSISVVAIRILATLAIAIITGLIVSTYSDPKSLLTKQMVFFCEHSHSEAKEGKIGKMKEISKVIQAEVWETLFALIVGAGIAAIMTTVSRGSIIGIAHSPLLATIAMMLLAFIITICSTVDAFVALGYVGTFPISSILAFLVFGPMIDIRTISLMLTSFKPKLVITIVLLVTEMVLILSALMNFVGR